MGGGIVQALFWADKLEKDREVQFKLGKKTVRCDGIELRFYYMRAVAGQNRATELPRGRPSSP